MDDKSGIDTCSLFASKGFFDVVYLSGGIEDFGTDFPQLLEGSAIPVFETNVYSYFIRRENIRSETRVV